MSDSKEGTHDAHVVMTLVANVRTNSAERNGSTLGSSRCLPAGRSAS
jgi:hypothetical protein